MRYLIIVLASLILMGCGSQITRSPLQHVHGENIFARELYTSGYIEFSKVYYHMSTSRLGNLEELKAESLQKCKNDWKDKIFLEFTNLDQGCSVSKEDDEKIKTRKSRFIGESEHLFNFKITEFKQLLIKVIGFKQFSSFNKQEKEIKLPEIKLSDLDKIETKDNYVLIFKYLIEEPSVEEVK